MMGHRLSNWLWLFDYIFIPLAVIFIAAYQPNFIHGSIDHLEAGRELACINEIFLGKLPYKDIFTPFGPLNIYLEAFFMFLFGKNLAVLRCYFYFGTIITLIIGYLIARQLCCRRIFSYITALALIVKTYLPFWAIRWGGFRFGSGLLAILCTIQFFKQEKNLWAFFAGIFVSVAFLITLDIGILSLVAIGFTFCSYVAYNFFKNKTLYLKSISFFIIGISTILVPFIFYFVLNGIFLPYVDTIIVIAKNHIRVWGQGGINLNLWVPIKPSQIFTYDFKYIFPVLLYICSIIYLIHRIIKKTICWKDYCILCLLTYGLLMYKAAFRAIHGWQFHMAMQPAIILGFVFLEDVFKQIIKLKQRITANSSNFVKFVVFVIIFVFAVYYAVFSEKWFYGKLKKLVSLSKVKSYLMPVYSALTIDRAKGIIVPREQAEEIESVTRYIDSVTSPDEPVFTFPEHGMYNFFANRPCLDRFNIAGFAWITPEYRQELLEDLKKMKPRYILYNRDLSLLARSIHRTEELLPEITEYINFNYEKEISFGRMDILRRKKY